MYNNKGVIVFILSCFLLGCDLTEIPESTASKEIVFKNEESLQLYANSFYAMLPSSTEIYEGDGMSDYVAVTTVPDFMKEGVYTAQSKNSGWDWTDLRNINFFLRNNVNPDVTPEIKNHFNGLARFFRAWFYFRKVQRYGDVPWIDEPINIDDEVKLNAPRDARTFVMDKVLEDVNYAIENITRVDDPSRTLITKDVALALKSRIALFEGTFRKYHSNDLASGLDDTVEKWLGEAVSAAKRIIDEGKYKLNLTGGEDLSYRELFINDNPVSTEIMLASVYDSKLDQQHSANWRYTSATYGIRMGFLKSFINTYLNIDGTPFTNNQDYKNMAFMEEVENRDKRLQQTIRLGDYKRISGGALIPAPPDFNQTFTGYQPIKWASDYVSDDTGTYNTNALSIFRYAEVLLNYAEAKAELGSLTNADWAMTIGALRRRAGITNGLTNLPNEIDAYLQSTYFPNVSSPIVLEVRRERGIELALEGFRFEDLLRWKRGELMEMPWKGLYVPQANELMDLNGDGISDVFFYNTTKAPEEKIGGVVYVDVDQEEYKLTDGAKGQLWWLPNIERYWKDKKYLYPIPQVHILKNPNLEQNPGW